MLAVLVEGGAERRLALAEVPEPPADSGGLRVRVGAISLNRGEVKGALTSAPALIGLDKRGSVEGRKVLVSAATGGVGLMAVQIAAKAGATVVALIRDGARAELLKRLGASTVVTSLSEAETAGPYDLILEGLGGETLGAALGWLASRGVCVLFGDTAGGPVNFDPDRFRHGPGTGPHGGTTLYGLFLGEEMTRTRPAEPLGRLLSMVAEGDLDPMISVTDSWTNIDAVARDLLARRYFGKAVLTLT